MKKFTIIASALLALALSLPAVGAAQQTPPVTPMTPTEPHERLTFFIGTWTIAEMPAQANFRETCDWLSSGRRHMMCRSTWQAASGPREGLSTFSYRSVDSTYIYNGYRPGGALQTLHAKPSADGKSWEFWGEEGTGATRKRTRVTLARNDDGTFILTEQTATGDGEWSAAETVHYQPVKD